MFDYQQKAKDFIRDHRRVYLALDMGMGKTLTAVASADEIGTRDTMLVAEKNEIVNSQNFKKEVETHFPNTEYLSLREDEIPEASGTRHVLGINPDGLAKHDPKDIVAIADGMIIDEATLAKNTQTQRFRRIHKIAKEVDHLILCSGTPMMNGAAELYAPLILLEHPMVAGKKVAARQAFEKVFAGGHYRKVKNTGKFYLDYVWWNKGANNVRELRYLLRDQFFIMSKRETDVFKKKVRRVEWVEMTLPWLGEYTKAWDEYFADAKKRKVDLENVKELRHVIENGQMYQVNCRWLAKKMAADIAAGVYGDRRIVAFNYFIEADKVFQEELTRLGVSFRTFDDIAEWKAGTEQVLVGRIKAHGKGGNAAEASVCLIAGMDYVPSNNIQAENRIDRPEQTRDMDVVYYLTRGEDVVDSHVRNINRDKIRKIEEFMRPLTEQEIAEMPYRLAILRSKFPKECELLGI